MMYELIERLVKFHGFTSCEGRCVDGDGAISRTWQKEIEVAWTGKEIETYEVVVEPFKNLPTAVYVSFIRNGQVVKGRVYDAGYARALNAIEATVKYAGYSLEVA